MPAPVLLLSGRRRRGEPPAAAGASGGLRLLVPTAAAAPTAPVGGLGALGGEREEAVAEAGRGVEDGSDRGRVPKAAGSPEIGMGASSMEDCSKRCGGSGAQMDCKDKAKPGYNATLIDAALRENADNVKYYKLEFRVESPSFQRHNVAVCCARDGKLYTMNAQAPESAWKAVQKDFFAMADSFSLMNDA
ncbi:unnamed protein product [Miscanthus lutarioriparius]|uniref:PsbP C-terminal domain-containing protein n=1 Tax=Miscanthus lutarioriparius TaxID=422564 RepID=A0A811P398_9POAL|nr:unnamed protein product [Miscanthus lutarioriparius]